MGEWLDRYRQAVAQKRAEALPGKPEGPSVSEAPPQPCPEQESNTFAGLLFPLETPLTHVVQLVRSLKPERE